MRTHRRRHRRAGTVLPHEERQGHAACGHRLHVTGVRTQRRQASAPSQQTVTTTLEPAEQKRSLAATFDLLDALSRSGALPMHHAQLHAVMGAAHACHDTLMNTLVAANLNPIEEVERSQLIIASTIHDRAPADLLLPTHLARLTADAPALLAGLGGARGAQVVSGAQVAPPNSVTAITYRPS